MEGKVGVLPIKKEPRRFCHYMPNAGARSNCCKLQWICSANRNATLHHSNPRPLCSFEWTVKLWMILYFLLWKKVP